MARPKSLLVSLQITTAGNTHNCRHDENHRIQKGSKRLTITSDGNKQHYCLACAKGFLVKDIERLNGILVEVNAASAT